MDTETHIEEVLTELKKRLAALLQDRMKRFVLYGSRARGDHERNSDVDVAIVVRDLDRELKMRILDEVADLELEYLTPISTLVLSEQTYNRLLQRQRRIALDIKNEGIPL